MKEKELHAAPVLMAGVLVIVLLAVSRLEQGHSQQDIRQLEQALQRTAVACYAVEGAYPPSVAYMCENYGLLYDESRYIVHYELAGSNFMPEITVMERMP